MNRTKAWYVQILHIPLNMELQKTKYTKIQVTTAKTFGKQPQTAAQFFTTYKKYARSYEVTGEASIITISNQI